MSVLDCCGLFGGREPESETEKAGFLKDSTSYYGILGDLYEELDRKKAELANLELDSEDSEDCESLQWYGGLTKGKNKHKCHNKHDSNKCERSTGDRGQGGDMVCAIKGSGGGSKRRNVNNNQTGQAGPLDLFHEIPLDDDNDPRGSSNKGEKDSVQGQMCKVEKQYWPRSSELR